MISIKERSFSKNKFTNPETIFLNSSVWLGDNPRPLTRGRTSKSSFLFLLTLILKIFSGLSSATFSISMPPSGEASPEGGMDIEKVAEESPEKIFKINVSKNKKEDFDVLPLVNGLGLSPNQTEEFKKIVSGLVNLFFEKDLSLIEINPLVIDQNDSLKCLDAKINIDENALFRQEDLLKLRDSSQENQKEIEAAKWDLNYVALDGNIGCMVNGAGQLRSPYILYFHPKPHN